jgi:hypothetical protein
MAERLEIKPVRPQSYQCGVSTGRSTTATAECLPANDREIPPAACCSRAWEPRVEWVLDDDFKDGVLNVHVPKSASAKPKTIDVKVS